jgi:hypothetical protein
VVLTAAAHRLIRPNRRRHLKPAGKIRTSTSATRQLRFDPGAVDRFGDAIKCEPVLCWVMIDEAPNFVPER